VGIYFDGPGSMVRNSGGVEIEFDYQAWPCGAQVPWWVKQGKGIIKFDLCRRPGGGLISCQDWKPENACETLDAKQYVTIPGCCYFICLGETRDILKQQK
jgi:hypothetical protein